MKTVIYYHSLNHGTETYAKWLGEALKADVVQYGMFTRATFEGYDRVIAMSAVYASLLTPVAGFIKSHWNKLRGKDVIVITCGAAPADDPVTLRAHRRIPEEIRSKIKIYTLPGSVPFAKGEAQAQYIRKEYVEKLVKEL